MMRENVTKFEALVTKWSATYRWQLISYVGLKVGDRRLLQSGRITLSATKPTGQKAFRFETANIIAGYHLSRLSPMSLKALLARAEKGLLAVGKESYRLVGRKPPGRYSISYYPFYHPSSSHRDTRLPSLLIDGQSKFQVQSDLPWHRSTVSRT